MALPLAGLAPASPCAPLRPPRAARRPPPPPPPRALFGRSDRAARQQTVKQAPRQAPKRRVEYGTDWYEETRQASRRFKTVREELEYIREANRAANNGRERKDLYTENWDGSEYKGSAWNVGTLLAVVSVLAPVIGLVFAFQTYGDLWG